METSRYQAALADMGITSLSEVAWEFTPILDGPDVKIQYIPIRN